MDALAGKTLVPNELNNNFVQETIARCSLKLKNLKNIDASDLEQTLPHFMNKIVKALLGRRLYSLFCFLGFLFSFFPVAIIVIRREGILWY